ncbi:hypothetical protein TNCV_667981 [Trichonephila clavipes]|nr:hypothetical protein TNCV_667981 [Trichonephila clavipes]
MVIGNPRIQLSRKTKVHQSFSRQLSGIHSRYPLKLARFGLDCFLWLGHYSFLQPKNSQQLLNMPTKSVVAQLTPAKERLAHHLEDSGCGVKFVYDQNNFHLEIIF